MKLSLIFLGSKEDLLSQIVDSEIIYDPLQYYYISFIYSTANGVIRVCHKSKSELLCKRVDSNNSENNRTNVENLGNHTLIADLAIHNLRDSEKYLLSVGKCDDGLCNGKNNTYLISIMDNDGFTGKQLEISKSNCEGTSDFVLGNFAESKFFDKEDNEICLSSFCYLRVVALTKKYYSKILKKIL